MSSFSIANATDIIVSKAGLKTFAEAGKRALRHAKAEDRADRLVASDGVQPAQSELARRWKDILENAADELTPDVLEDYRRRLHLIPAKEVLIGAALLDRLGPEPPKAVAPKLHKAWKAKARQTLRLGLFFGRLTYGQLSKAATNGYWKACAAIAYTSLETTPTKTLSYMTVRGDLEELQRSLKDYAKRNRLDFVPVVDIPHERVRRDVYLTRKDVADLLWASRGRVKNRDTGNWVKVLKDGKLVNFIDTTTRDHCKGVGRAIILEIYSGWRHEGMLRAMWGRYESHGCIDVDKGMIHRVGTRQPETRKTLHPTSKMARRLLQHARRWRKADRRRGFRHVIRKRDGTPFGSIHRPFSLIVEAAGLDHEIVVHIFRHTLATWLAFAGAAQDSAAKLLGMSPRTLDQVYRHFAPATEDNAIEVLDDPKCRATLRDLTREATPEGPKLKLDHVPMRATKRTATVLKRVHRARADDAGIQ